MAMMNTNDHHGTCALVAFESGLVAETMVVVDMLQQPMENM
eukprot:CAMPEP_0202714626 /NCGR_PEP_ID=MMETSP1385-20130828/77113_1 /ASSEMBLY_ACC=CAM_ASM_000861 /TAXON_ID=933848 /ORGANISM="Elphidium margaritaceum" /LENGTH=40 /DNA_ID= /DNA_START= /DNA_END= /DNA_ORIENTATION=